MTNTDTTAEALEAEARDLRQFLADRPAEPVTLTDLIKRYGEYSSAHLPTGDTWVLIERRLAELERLATRGCYHRGEIRDALDGVA